MDKRLSYYIWPLGCAMNYADAERVAMVLDSLGFQEVKKETDANIIVVMACSVRQSAIDRILGKKNNWQKLKKKQLKLTVLSGCVLPKDLPKMEKIFDIIFNILELENLPKLIKKQGLKIQRPKIKDDFWNILPKRTNDFQALIPISFGCDKYCSYCAVPYTRGRETNRPADEILKEVKNLADKNYKEINLLGQTVNSYINPTPATESQALACLPARQGYRVRNFTDLLIATAKLAPDAWIRFSSPYPTEFDEKLIDAVKKYDNICNNFHLPVQSGSDKILKKMNRRYTKDEVLKLIAKIRKQIPDCAVTTDVIVGFPDESEEDFNETVELFKKAKFDMAYISQYSPRPGTVSQKTMKDNVPKKDKVKRDKELNKVLETTALSHNKKYVGKVVDVLVEQKKKNFYLGKTKTFKTVKFTPPRVADGPAVSTGTIVKAKITKAQSFGLEGKLTCPELE